MIANSGGTFIKKVPERQKQTWGMEITSPRGDLLSRSTGLIIIKTRAVAFARSLTINSVVLVIGRLPSAKFLPDPRSTFNIIINITERTHYFFCKVFSLSLFPRGRAKTIKKVRAGGILCVFKCVTVIIAVVWYRKLGVLYFYV